MNTKSGSAAANNMTGNNGTGRRGGPGTGSNAKAKSATHEMGEAGMEGGNSELQELYIEILKDTYNAEKQLLAALSKLAKAASDESLSDAFTSHRAETMVHLERLESIFAGLGMAARGKMCEGMKGLIKEGAEALEDYEEGATRDAAMIAAAQKCEHYELAAYGTLRAFATRLSRKEDIRTLTTTLDEESACDERLTALALSGPNEEAATTEAK